MTRKQQSASQGAAKPAADIVGPERTLLDVLLGMMRDPDISSGERMEIARICLPFRHPRIAQLHPPEPEPDKEPVDICDPNYIVGLLQLLNFSLHESEQKGREIPDSIWNMMKYIPRTRDELNAPVSVRLKGFGTNSGARTS